MATLESGRMGRGTAADEDQLGASRLDLSESPAQLRGTFSAVGSTEVTDEAKQDRALGSQPAQLYRVTFRVESDQRPGSLATAAYYGGSRTEGPREVRRVP